MSHLFPLFLHLRSILPSSFRPFATALFTISVIIPPPLPLSAFTDSRSTIYFITWISSFGNTGSSQYIHTSHVSPVLAIHTHLRHRPFLTIVRRYGADIAGIRVCQSAPIAPIAPIHTTAGVNHPVGVEC